MFLLHVLDFAVKKLETLNLGIPSANVLFWSFFRGSNIDIHPPKSIYIYITWNPKNEGLRLIFRFSSQQPLKKHNLKLHPTIAAAQSFHEDVGYRTALYLNTTNMNVMVWRMAWRQKLTLVVSIVTIVAWFVNCVGWLDLINVRLQAGLSSCVRNVLSSKHAFSISSPWRDLAFQAKELGEAHIKTWPPKRFLAQKQRRWSGTPHLIMTFRAMPRGLLAPPWSNLATWVAVAELFVGSEDCRLHHGYIYSWVSWRFFTGNVGWILPYSAWV